MFKTEYTDRFIYVHAGIFKQETFLTPVNMFAKYKNKPDKVPIKH